jgi:small subunit ribosomal protein S17
MSKKRRLGVVVSNKSMKTITVAIQIRYQHPKFLKTLVKTKRYLVHDELEISKPGDVVLIEECAPLSRRKRWQLVTMIQSYEGEKDN